VVGAGRTFAALVVVAVLTVCVCVSSATGVATTL